MAKILPTESISVAAQRRTWRTNIESAEGQAPTVTAHRELVRRNADGNELLSRDQNAGVVTRSVPAVLAETVTLTSGKVLTVAELVEAIPALIDRWEAEDEAAVEARAAAEAAAAQAAAEAAAAAEADAAAEPSD